MVGKIYKIITPYFDSASGRTQFKSRPGLIIATPNGYDSDYIVLPVSTIQKQQYIDPKYDIKVKKEDYLLLNLDKDSYIRTGKQVNINRSNIGDLIGDMKTHYEEKYLDILGIMEKFHKELLDKAM